jgi:hypothetical protein
MQLNREKIVKDKDFDVNSDSKGQAIWEKKVVSEGQKWSPIRIVNKINPYTVNFFLKDKWPVRWLWPCGWSKEGEC